MRKLGGQRDFVLTGLGTLIPPDDRRTEPDDAILMGQGGFAEYFPCEPFDHVARHGTRRKALGNHNAQSRMSEIVGPHV